MNNPCREFENLSGFSRSSRNSCIIQFYGEKARHTGLERTQSLGFIRTGYSKVNKNAGFAGCVARMLNHTVVGHEIAQHLLGFLQAVTRFSQFVRRSLWSKQFFRGSVEHGLHPLFHYSRNWKSFFLSSQIAFISLVRTLTLKRFQNAPLIHKRYNFNVFITGFLHKL